MWTVATDRTPASLSPVENAEVFEAPAVLRVIWADPEHMPEHLALWSLKHFASRASSAVYKLRRDHHGAEPDDLERMVIERQTRVAMVDGACVGGPFLVLIPVAFCAALLAQAQMALELAALAGCAPDDEMRAADLLVMQGAYTSTDEASAALAEVTREQPDAKDRRSPSGAHLAMIRRMAYLLGLLDTSEEKPSLLSRIMQWCLLGIAFVVGLVLPLVWVPYMTVAIRRSALRVGERARQFYAERSSAEAGVAVRKSRAVRVEITGALLRMLALTVLPVGVAVIALAANLDLGISPFWTALILLIVVSALGTLAWVALRRWRHGPRQSP